MSEPAGERVDRRGLTRVDVLFAVVDALLFSAGSTILLGAVVPNAVIDQVLSSPAGHLVPYREWGWLVVFGSLFTGFALILLAWRTIRTPWPRSVFRPIMRVAAWTIGIFVVGFGVFGAVVGGGLGLSTGLIGGLFGLVFGLVAALLGVTLGRGIARLWLVWNGPGIRSS